MRSQTQWWLLDIDYPSKDDSDNVTGLIELFYQLWSFITVLRVCHNVAIYTYATLVVELNR